MPLELAGVVRQAVEMSRPLIDARRHRLTVTVPPEPIRVEGDFVRLAQIVSNLLNNAAKYTDEGGEIRLTVEKSAPDRSSGQAVVRVRDNGRGIEPAALSSLFDLFYQVDRSLARSDGGLGIGLALVKSLVEMHGGRVEAYSAGRGKGSEFAVYLPLLREIPSSAPPRPVASSPTIHPTRILVVDDSEDSADSMASLLRLEGHEVWVAHDGNKAVEVALRERPAVVLLDIGLPGLNGYQVCRILREEGLTDTLVVAMTGYGQDEDRRRSQEARFDAHLVKPVNLSALRNLLARQHAVP